MKLGVPWTSKSKKGAERSAPHDDADSASVHERLDDLTRQLERLSRITAGKVRPPGAAAEAITRDRPPPDEVEERPVRSRRRPEPVAEVEEEPAPSREVARFAGDRTLNRSPLRPVYSGSDLDQTLAEIAARQRDLEGAGRVFTQRRAEAPRPMAPRPMAPPAQNLSGLEDQLRKITTQIESLRRPTEAEDMMPALRQELAEISRSLAEAMPRNAIEAIETEVRSLAERLDHSRQSGADGSALANIEHGLAEVRDALHSLKPAESLVGFQAAIQGLSRKIDSIATHQQDPVVLQQLESAITGLRGIVAHVASDDTLAQLTDEVRGIAVKLERTAGAASNSDSLANLERQIGAIAEAVDQANAQGRQAPAKLEGMVRSLADKIEKLQPNRGDTIAFGQLEDRITKLVEKLDTSGSRLNHLETIERGLTDVLVHLEEQRARFGTAMRATGNDAVVEALKQDLNAVNGTLNRVVDRLAHIETGIRGGVSNRPGSAAMPPAATLPAAPPAPPPVAVRPPAVPAASPPPAPVAPPPVTRAPVVAAAPVPPPPPANPQASLSDRLAAAAQVQRPAPPRERQPIDPSLPPDHPLEPGAAVARAGQTPADRIAASEAALGPAKPPVIPDPGGKTNFVAAARRAALTASSLPEAAGDKTAAPSDGEPKKSLGQRFSGKIRSLVVGSSVVILTLGALRLGMTLIEPYSGDAPAATKSAEAPAILPQPRTAARTPSDPTVTGSTERSEAALDTPRPGSAFDVPAATDVKPPNVPAARQADVTGSIPPRASEPPGVPMPQSRPNGQGQGEAKSPLLAAATAGDPAAAYELAVRYIEGRGVEHSYEEAARWLTRASKSGLAPAQFRLGSLYEKGLGLKKNLHEARRLYAEAAATGNAKAMHNLAVLYAEGFDGKPDYKNATEWFRKGADRGIADSQYNLGVLFARGVGVEQNLAESYKWFALAAAQGDKEAARKRDEISARLDAESLIAARLAVKTWSKLPEPDEATVVKAPAGGWDGETSAAPAKRRPRTGTPQSGPLKIGPG